MPRVSIVKQIKVGDRWRLRAIPKDDKGRYDWQALPTGRYLIEWYENGKRKRQAAGFTPSDARETARRKRHVLEGRALGLDSPPDDRDQPLRKSISQSQNAFPRPKNMIQIP